MAMWAAMGSAGAVAGPFSREDVANHHVPADKRLRPDWVRELTARGSSTWYSGEDLRTIGMPVGGICAGQVYLSGDGRLTYWDIFNRNHNTGYGAVNYKVGRLPTEVVANGNQFVPALPIEQGFGIRIEELGAPRVRRLDATGFGSVRFCGEYPMARVEYRDASLPVEVGLEAFSSFIPLDVEASSLPATLMRYTVRNLGGQTLRVSLAGWLENRVLVDSGVRYAGRVSRVNGWRSGEGWAGVFGGVEAEAESNRPATRPPEVFADFEQEDYGGWKVEGDAFGPGPARGTLPSQNPVSGFAGQGLVNTFLGGSDRLHGRLISPEFTIERSWISFLVGGGAHAGRTCMNLVVDGEVVRTVTGRNQERLERENWRVADLVGRRAHLEIVDRESGGWGHINIDQIEFCDEPQGATLEDLPRLPDYGTMGLALLDEAPALGCVSVPEGDVLNAVFGASGLALMSDEVAGVRAPMNGRLVGAVGCSFELKAGESRAVVFTVTWCMPNMYRDSRRVGNAYAKRFGGAAEVAGFVAAHRERLVQETRLWHETYYDSTLPWWLLDRVHSTVSTLATATCQWWENGRFWAWEGCGCCHGTCGHVWNYAHAVARLFPSLERSAREMQDFAPGVGFNERTGSIGFRGEGWDLWAGDSQGGYILKAYREHLCGVDGAFLRRVWPRVRRAVEFLMSEDGDEDGLLEGRQHQTYDQDYHGANTFVGALYLGALRAAEEMGREMGEVEFADRCRRIFESGSRRTMERLFNGEYFIQQVDLEKHREWQYADGCLADQLFGQSWSDQVGLGYLYPPDAVRKALASIWKYCWAPDVGPQNRVHAPERWFAYPGEAGLFTCTWPRSRHLGPRSTRYRDEIWTGIEYQVAHHMVGEGMLTEGLAMCRAIHERYHPEKRNPWNEIECGDHYARGMASWGVLVALSGFSYHGPAGRIGFAPRLTPEGFRCVFTAAEGWGTYGQQREDGRQTSVIDLRWGRLRLTEVRLGLAEGARLEGGQVRIGDQEVRAEFESVEGGVRVRLAEETNLQAGERLEVICRIPGTV
jgi:non-lysosomal glucosylceramidase